MGKQKKELLASLAGFKEELEESEKVLEDLKSAEEPSEKEIQEQEVVVAEIKVDIEKVEAELAGLVEGKPKKKKGKASKVAAKAVVGEQMTVTQCIEWSRKMDKLAREKAEQK